MTSDRILQLSAAVEAMPDGPSRQRFSALLAELTAAEGLPAPVSIAAGSHGEEWSHEPSPLDGLLGEVVPRPADSGPAEEPKKRRWRRNS